MCNLVLSGSAALYPAHLGACQALYETVFRDKLPEAIVATSGGALVGAFLSSGQKPREGLPLLQRVLPMKHIRPNWAGFWDKLLRRKHKRLGKFTLDGIERCLERHVPKQFCNTKIPLYVTATDLAHNELIIFDPGRTPTVSVAWAACTSSSMPGLFALRPWEGRALTDGGLLNNYPVDVLDGPAVGVQLRGRDDEVQEFPDYPDNDLELALACLRTMRMGLEREHVEDAPWAQTLVVNVPWHSLNFIGLDEETVERLYMVGYQSAMTSLDDGRLAGLYLR